MRSQLHFTGSPPFVLHYTVLQLSPIVRRQSLEQGFFGSRGELVLQPGVGRWQYTFDTIDDANQALALQGIKREQKIYEMSDARWMADELSVRSCQGETVDVEVEIKVCHLSFLIRCRSNSV